MGILQRNWREYVTCFSQDEVSWYHCHLRITSDQIPIILKQGCHGQGKLSGKRNFFQVGEKSGNFVDGQGNLERILHE